MMDKSKPTPKPRHVIRTKVLAYRFGSMKAAETAKQNRGTQRQPSKLPTTLNELPDKVKAKVNAKSRKP